MNHPLCIGMYSFINNTNNNDARWYYLLKPLFINIVKTCKEQSTIPFQRLSNSIPGFRLPLVTDDDDGIAAAATDPNAEYTSP